MYLKEYFEKYDELMNLVYSEETDIIAYAEMENQLKADLIEEYMWYKHEDYMLWKRESAKRVNDFFKTKEGLEYLIYITNEYGTWDEYNQCYTMSFIDAVDIATTEYIEDHLSF